MSTSTALKAEGNAHHAAGAHDLAVVAYTQALALLLLDESAGEEDGLPGELPRLQLRAALLANRAAAHLAAGASLCAASLTQCIADCDACLALGLADGHPLCVKATFRRRGAEALLELAVLRQAAEAQLEAGSWADALRTCDAALALPARAAAPATLLRGAPHVASLERLAGLALCKVSRFGPNPSPDPVLTLIQTLLILTLPLTLPLTLTPTLALTLQGGPVCGGGLALRQGAARLPARRRGSRLSRAPRESEQRALRAGTRRAWRRERTQRRRRR